MNRKIKKIISAALACTIIVSSALTAPMSVSADTTAVVSESTKTKTYTITKKKLTAYFGDTEKESRLKTSIYYVNGSDVPYLNVEDWITLYKDFAAGTFGNNRFDLTFKINEKDNNVVYLIRENGNFLRIDFANDKFTFLDYNEFIDIGGEGVLSFTLGFDIGDKDSPRYLKKLSTSTQRDGDTITMDLAEYGIDLVRKGKNYYIPLQTLSDIFLSPYMINVLYNGKAVFFIHGGFADVFNNGDYNELGKLYYKGDRSGRVSKTMAEFSYNELCFALDNLYGLKEQHNIKDFRTLIRQIGYEKYFLSTNQTRTDKCLFDLINLHLDDQHSFYLLPSYASDYNSVMEYIEKKGYGHSYSASIESETELMTAREKLNPDGIPAYQEIGDTAFITFDIFNIFNGDVDYYKTAPTAEATDTIGIIAYSVQQILRKDSPIKNVVLDLSCNPGGEMSAMIYTIGAFLEKASISVEDTNTGALVTNDYKVDTNFDGKFNSEDTLAGKGLNLYCLESGDSFSCANDVTCAFKESGKVTLLGNTSGGGTCVVTYLTTASGSLVQLSSSSRTGVIKNGSLYDMDRGAEPDIPITKIEHYFDRPALAEYIHGLF